MIKSLRKFPRPLPNKGYLLKYVDPPEEEIMVKIKIRNGLIDKLYVEIIEEHKLADLKYESIVRKLDDYFGTDPRGPVERLVKESFDVLLLQRAFFQRESRFDESQLFYLLVLGSIAGLKLHIPTIRLGWMDFIQNLLTDVSVVPYSELQRLTPDTLSGDLNSLVELLDIWVSPGGRFEEYPIRKPQIEKLFSDFQLIIALRKLIGEVCESKPEIALCDIKERFEFDAFFQICVTTFSKIGAAFFQKLMAFLPGLEEIDKSSAGLLPPLGNILNFAGIIKTRFNSSLVNEAIDQALDELSTGNIISIYFICPKTPTTEVSLSILESYFEFANQLDYRAKSMG